MSIDIRCLNEYFGIITIYLNTYCTVEFFVAQTNL